MADPIVTEDPASPVTDPQTVPIVERLFCLRVDDMDGDGHVIYLNHAQADALCGKLAEALG